MKKALLIMIIAAIFALPLQAQEEKTEELKLKVFKIPSFCAANDNWALYFSETNPTFSYSLSTIEPAPMFGETQRIIVKNDRNDDLVKAVIYTTVIFEGIDLALTLHAKHKYGANFVEVNPIGNFFLQKGDGAVIGYKIASTLLGAWGTWELYKRNQKWGMVAAFGNMGFRCSVVVWNLGQSQKFNKR